MSVPGMITSSDIERPSVEQSVPVCLEKDVPANTIFLWSFVSCRFQDVPILLVDEAENGATTEDANVL